VNVDRDYQQLYEQVLRTKRGRHYFNPLKTI
jgi:hypothetical protein